MLRSVLSGTSVRLRKAGTVGFFGGYVFDGSTWHSFDPDSDQRPGIAAPWLSVYIHDSDIATVRYEPAGPGAPSR